MSEEVTGLIYFQKYPFRCPAVKNDGGLHQGNDGEDGKKWTDYRCHTEIEYSGFAEGLDVEVRKREEFWFLDGAAEEMIERRKPGKGTL